MFDLKNHVKKIEIKQDTIINISIDNNVFPYISATFWQVYKENNKYVLNQIHEITAKDPNNTASKAGILSAKWLKSINYNSRIHLYGDRSTKNRNSISDEKLSFAQIFTNSLTEYGYRVENKMLSFAPAVADIGDFLNAVLEEKLDFCKIQISESCKESINDYIVTKQDKDGTILKKRETDPKTKISYEPNGHLLDTFKDLIVSMFNEEFKKFQNRFMKLQVGMVKNDKKKSTY